MFLKLSRSTQAASDPPVAPLDEPPPPPLEPGVSDAVLDGDLLNFPPPLPPRFPPRPPRPPPQDVDDFPRGVDGLLVWGADDDICAVAPSSTELFTVPSPFAGEEEDPAAGPPPLLPGSEAHLDNKPCACCT